MSNKVSVHWNRTLKTWSIRRGRSRVQHVQTYALHDVTFRVSEAGRQRALQAHQRNVHAFARGSPSAPPREQEGAVRVRYNPYKAPTFTEAETGSPVHHAQCAVFLPNGQVWIIAPLEK